MKQFRLFITIVAAALLLVACGNKKEDNAKKEEVKEEARIYEDSQGHKVELPQKMDRVIFHGETLGDLVALNITPIGSMEFWYTGAVFENELPDIEDVGFPISEEKVLALKPDLIIIGNTEPEVYEQMSKIAPTIVFDTFAPLDDRLTTLGEIFSKEDEAKTWLAQYHEKEDAMWKQLKEDGQVKDGETASVLTFYPGNRLFVMASTGFSQIIYQDNGFDAKAPIEKLLADGTGFEEISQEVLADYVGDRIFILEQHNDEDEQMWDSLKKSAVWQNLAPVKDEKVYQLDILRTYSDATTREWLLDEIPNILK